MTNNTLYIIPARGGSKGIPYKNIKEFGGKPLIYYSIDLAREFVEDKDICVSTDDNKIIKIVEDYGLRVPFTRPTEFASDTATTNDVLLHAIRHYENLGKNYETIVLLQPTSPLRQKKHISEAIKLYSDKIDMVVSVCKSNAGGLVCEDNEKGFLELVFNKTAVRRQEAKTLYEYNGAIYVINVNSLKRDSLAHLKKKIKFEMPRKYSIDIDTPLDWDIAEFLYNKFSTTQCDASI